jgi:ATP-dependent 26S proteasome regulatory subunit
MNLDWKLDKDAHRVLISSDFALSHSIESNEQVEINLDNTKIVSVVYVDQDCDCDIIFPDWLIELYELSQCKEVCVSKILETETQKLVNVQIIENFEGYNIQGARNQIINHSVCVNGQRHYIYVNDKKFTAVITSDSQAELIKLTKHTRIRFEGNGIPSIKDIGGQSELIKWYDDYLFALGYKEHLQKWKIPTPRGLLLSGKPGLGKTHFMKAFIADAGVHYISISAPDIITPLAGDGDKILEECFDEARQNSPSVICIDEIDALCLNRSSRNQNYENRVVTVLLKEMDGLESRGDVLVIGTTNRPESIDLAFKRPGRFTYQIELNYPNFEDRLKIFKIHLQTIKNELTDADFNELAENTVNFTGADIASLVHKAGLIEIRDHFRKTNSEMQEPNLKIHTILSQLIN